MGETKEIKVKVESRDRIIIFDGMRSAFGENIQRALGIEKGDTVFLSARKAEKLIVPIEFPDGSKHCPKCGLQCDEVDFVFNSPCDGIEHKFHPTRTLKISDLTKGVETEVWE